MYLDSFIRRQLQMFIRDITYSVPIRAGPFGGAHIVQVRKNPRNGVGFRVKLRTLTLYLTDLVVPANTCNKGWRRVKGGRLVQPGAYAFTLPPHDQRAPAIARQPTNTPFFVVPPLPDSSHQQYTLFHITDGAYPVIVILLVTYLHLPPVKCPFTTYNIHFTIHC